MSFLFTLCIFFLVSVATSSGWNRKFCETDSDCNPEDIYPRCADQMFFNACDEVVAQRANALVYIGSSNPRWVANMASDAMEYYNLHAFRDKDLSKRNDIKRLIDVIGDTEQSRIHFLLRMRPLIMGEVQRRFSDHFNTTSQFIEWVRSG